jgi:folylpolyglutamate synthase/dihydropteroate synthase
LVSAIIFTKSKNKKAENPKQLLKIFNKINQNKPVKTKIIQNPRSAMGYARKISDKNDLVVVAGSIYLAGEMI